MPKKPAATRARQSRRIPARATPSVSISFTPQELQFLIQTLRDLPIKGTPDSLAQALPLIQHVRMKFASALQVAAGGQPPEKASSASPPEEAPAAE
jgi:hypothetical protein